MNLKEQYLGFLNSKTLLNSGYLSLQQFSFDKISKSSNLDGLVNIKINENEVLGKRIEHFFEYAIRSSDQYQLIAKNLQIFRDKITIGELDFIIKEVHSQLLIHIELVYKFYLYNPNGKTEIDKWIGPNKKDALPFKLKKLKEHQLPLLSKSETKPILQKLNLTPDKITQQVCFLGNLFIPLKLKTLSSTIINKECIAGYWINFEGFTNEQFKPHSFHVPQKKYWMVDPKKCQDWQPYEKIKTEVLQQLDQKKSPLLWMKSNEDTYTKFFIVWWS